MNKAEMVGDPTTEYAPSPVPAPTYSTAVTCGVCGEATAPIASHKAHTATPSNTASSTNLIFPIDITPFFFTCPQNRAPVASRFSECPTTPSPLPPVCPERPCTLPPERGSPVRC